MIDIDKIIRFLNRNCNSQDLADIDKWIGESDENAKWLFDLESLWSLKDEVKYSRKKEIEEAFDSFSKLAQPKKIRRAHLRIPRYKRSIGIAAMVIIVILSGGLAFNSLIMDTNLLGKKNNMNEIYVPRGQSSSIRLADGTKIWLNSDTKLIYPTSFSSKKRYVEIVGEGFFEVEHNKESPFVVKSGSISTTVLGTEFNVRAYENEEISIALKNGIIEVSDENNRENSLILNKSNLRVDISEDKVMRKGEINAHALSQWRSGELYFHNESLRNIANTLERKFDIQISIEDKTLENLKFTSRIQKNTTLTEVLNILKETRKINYIIDQNKISIHKTNRE